MEGKKIPDSEAYKLLEKRGLIVAKYNFIKHSKSFSKDVEKHVNSYPCVIKIDGDIIHKKKAGCVEIIYKHSEAKKKISNVIKNSRKIKVNGMLIQEFVAGSEVMIGARRDKQFGTVVMFGSGGYMADIIKDVSFRVLPANTIEFETMIKETKAYQVLFEERDIDDIIEAISKIAELMEDNLDIIELDINPLFIKDKPIVGDVRIMVK